MSKNAETSVRTPSQRRMSTKQLTICALLCALDVVLGRFLTMMPSAAFRPSIETVPVILAGYFYGPIAGMMVGFVGDTVGCLFTPYGWDPLISVTPMLIGMFAGLLRFLVYKVEKPWDIWKVALTILPGKVFGSIYWTSQCLVWLGYSKKGLGALMIARGTEAMIEWALESVVVFLLVLTGMFRRAKLFPPEKKEKTLSQKFRLASAILLLVQVAVFVAGSLTIGLGFMNKELGMLSRVGNLAAYLVPTYAAIVLLIVSIHVTEQKKEQ